MYELVIFDCGGVLVDSEPIANSILAEVFKAIDWQSTISACSMPSAARYGPYLK